MRLADTLLAKQQLNSWGRQIISCPVAIESVSGCLAIQVSCFHIVPFRNISKTSLHHIGLNQLLPVFSHYM